MHVFLAGATGVIGIRLVPLLVEAGHRVTGMTRSEAGVARLAELGAQGVVCDVYDAPLLAAVVGAAEPDLVMHQLTDLPDEAADLAAGREANARIRTEGTRNLLAAADGVRMLAQSIAWPGGPAVEEHERLVLAAGGVVVRYGQFWGPGTYHREAPAPPAIHVDEAARRTVELLDAPSGVVEVVG